MILREAYPPFSCGPMMYSCSSFHPGRMCMIMVEFLFLGSIWVRYLPGTSMTGRSTVLLPDSALTVTILHATSYITFAKNGSLTIDRLCSQQLSGSWML